jgi:hypothetical protein
VIPAGAVDRRRRPADQAVLEVLSRLASQTRPLVPGRASARAASDGGGSVSLLSGTRSETAPMHAYPDAVRPRVSCLLARVRVVATRCSRCLIDLTGS